MEKQERISDEDFINNYTARNKHRNRSDKYVKEKDSISAKGILYYVFLTIVFLAAYYLFSSFFFSPKI